MNICNSRFFALKALKYYKKYKQFFFLLFLYFALLFQNCPVRFLSFPKLSSEFFVLLKIVQFSLFELTVFLAEYQAENFVQSDFVQRKNDHKPGNSLNLEM